MASSGAIAMGGLGIAGLGSMAVSPEEMSALQVAARNGDPNAISALASLNQIPNAGSGNKGMFKMFNGKLGAGIMGALGGAAMGSQVTASQGKTGFGGTIGGALGAGIGTLAGPVGTALGGILGSLVGSLFDTPKEAELKDLPEIEEEQLKELQQINKNLNTVNETMENIINAPSNFTLPIPKGILSNSITAQSALATPLQAGGLIIRSGPAYLHTGDRVNGVSDTGGGMSILNNITINGANKDPREIANEVAAAVKNELYQQTQRTGGYRTRF